MAKPKSVSAPAVPILTRPVAVKGGKGRIKAELKGHEKQIDRIISIRREQDNLIAEEAQLRAPIEQAAKAERLKLEKNTGKTIKSVLVNGTNQPARFTWRNAYAPIAITHEQPLREALGPHFDSLFVRQKVVQANKLTDVQVKDLRVLLGARFGEFFTVHERIVAQDELLEKRTTLVESGAVTKKQSAAIDLVLDQVQVKPSLSVK